MDQEVPIEHSKALINKCKNAVQPFWASSAGHNDLDTKYRKNYF